MSQSPAARQMHLAAFLIAGPVAHSHALWRHPLTAGDFLAPELYQDIARILERGKFDLAFFADRLAMADTFGHSLATGVTYGDQDAIRLDPVPPEASLKRAAVRTPAIVGDDNLTIEQRVRWQRVAGLAEFRELVRQGLC